MTHHMYCSLIPAALKQSTLLINNYAEPKIVHVSNAGMYDLPTEFFIFIFIEKRICLYVHFTANVANYKNCLINLCIYQRITFRMRIYFKKIKSRNRKTKQNKFK